MLSTRRHFNWFLIAVILIVLESPVSVWAAWSGAEPQKGAIEEGKGTPQFDELNKNIKLKETGFYADFFDNHIWDQGEQFFCIADFAERLTKREIPAKGLNKYGQVPDDQRWFTNRNGRSPLSVAELKKGANITDGPSMDGPWLVTKGKLQGRSPGFFIKDARGDRYLIKLDVKDFPEMASSAEVIGSKFFYAIGYNVPQYTVAYFKPEILKIEPGSYIIDEHGFKKPLDQTHIQRILDRGYRLADGRYRSSASRLLDGILKGYCSFSTRRKADPGDLYPHRYRREMRALRVFCAWLNHHDIRRGNTMDMLVNENGKAHLKHYLVDFGSVFGSQTIRGKWSETSHEYILDPGPTLKTLLGLGIFYQRPWLDKAHTIYPSIGYFTADDFEPKKWKQEIPNFAFSMMTAADARWAAETVRSFTDDQIRALVETGEMSDPQAKEYLIRTIIARRDKVVAAWLGPKS